jgi:hypothetical protein
MIIVNVKPAMQCFVSLAFARYNLGTAEQYQYEMHQRSYASEVDDPRYGSPSYPGRNAKSIVNGYRPSQPPPAPPSNDLYM